MEAHHCPIWTGHYRTSPDTNRTVSDSIGHHHRTVDRTFTGHSPDMTGHDRTVGHPRLCPVVRFLLKLAPRSLQAEKAKGQDRRCRGLSRGVVKLTGRPACQKLRRFAHRAGGPARSTPPEPSQDQDIITMDDGVYNRRQLMIIEHSKSIGISCYDHHPS